MKSMKKSPKQNWESNIRRTPIILGLSAALCMPSAFSYANASDPVAGELVQSVQQGRTVTGKIIDDTGVLVWKIMDLKLILRYSVRCSPKNVSRS